jgi:hypothetical protein
VAKQHEMKLSAIGNILGEHLGMWWEQNGFTMRIEPTPNPHLPTSVFFQDPSIVKSGFFSNENGAHFAIVKFYGLIFWLYMTIFYGIMAMVFSNDSIFGYGIFKKVA